MSGPLPHPQGSSPSIRLENLGLHRGGRWLFRNLDVSIPPGRFVAITGRSGVGKSSLLQCVAGLLPPTEGRTFTHIDDHHSNHKKSCAVGVIFQNHLLINNSSILENVLCGRIGCHSSLQTLFGFSRTERQEAFRVLNEVGLAPQTHRWVAEVSGGEAQRTAVARTLFQDPEIILADEPVSNLDPGNACHILGLLHTLTKSRGKTVLCVLHDPALVAQFADGILEFDGSPRGFHYQESHGKD
ncbi:MAG: ATP-binding cassette domain-containing protein [Verrucomicrobiae bacterium]|nr:ATP-binding cassette domain-containing protein [Verrucomicrobiae bacterium]